MSLGPRALTDPLYLIEHIFNKSEKEVKDVCRDLARELWYVQWKLGVLDAGSGVSTRWVGVLMTGVCLLDS